MTTKVQAVSPEFLQKVVGFAEAANVMMKSAEDQRTAIREAAKDAVDVLEKAGKLEEDQKSEEGKKKLIEGFVNDPSMALKLASSLVKEGEAFPGAAPPFKKKEGEGEGEKGGEEKKDEDEEAAKEASIGGAAESEDQTQREAETKAAAAPANVSRSKESDEVWNKGFGFSN